MKKILVLASLFITLSSNAGLLPRDGMKVCYVTGFDAQGLSFTFQGAGIHMVEACDNATYFCRIDKRIVSCALGSP